MGSRSPCRTSASSAIAQWSTRVFSPPGPIRLDMGTDKPARLTPGCWRWRSASHIWLGESAAGFINGTPPMSRKGANVQSRIPEERGHGAGRSPVHFGPRGRRSRNALVVTCSHVGPAERVCRTRLVPLVLRHWDRPERFAGEHPGGAGWAPRGLSSSASCRHAVCPDSGVFPQQIVARGPRPAPSTGGWRPAPAVCSSRRCGTSAWHWPRFSPAPTASRPGVRPAGTRASASVT